MHDFWFLRGLVVLHKARRPVGGSRSSALSTFARKNFRYLDCAIVFFFHSDIRHIGPSLPLPLHLSLLLHILYAEAQAVISVKGGDSFKLSLFPFWRLKAWEWEWICGGVCLQSLRIKFQFFGG